MTTASPLLDVPTSTSRSATLAGLRAEVVPIALELGLLGAAAQFLTSLRATSAATRPDLMGAFHLAREGLRRIPQEAWTRRDKIARGLRDGGERRGPLCRPTGRRGAIDDAMGRHDTSAGS